MNSRIMRILRPLALFVCSLAFPAVGRAADPATAFVDSLPAYAPAGQVDGTVRLWGHGSYRRNFMGNLLGRWVREFTALQPGVRFENRMYGTASAIGALFTGVGEIALLGEEISPSAALAFRRARGYAPTEIQVATGSLDVNFFDYAHMIFVHRDNPLAQLTVAQLEGIFGAEHKLGPRNLRTWGDVGLTGEWADRPIQPYSWKVDEDFALFFRERVLGDSHRWNPAIKEYVHLLRPDGAQYDHGQRIVDALADDRYGIAISNVRYVNPAVKVLALAPTADTPAVAATTASLIAQAFPLVRIIPAFIDQSPGQPIDPAVREFLRYVLSRAGQRALIEETGYLPLGPAAIAEQLVKLGRNERPAPAVAAASAPAHGNEFTSQALPPVQPRPSQTGIIRVRGNGELGEIVQRWVAAFQARQPAVRFAVQLDGSDVGIAALTTGQAELALLGRAAAAQEVKAFEWIFRYRPRRVEILTGSAGVPGRSPALVFQVHPDNPLAGLTLAQADALFSPERLRGAPAPLLTWGDLGLTGEWSARPINLYAPDTESGTGRFFRDVVLRDSRKLYWERLREFTDSPDTAGAPHDASARIVAAVARDRYALGVAALQSGSTTTKPLRLMAEKGAPAELVSAGSVAERRYALARPVFAYFNQGAGGPLDPLLAEFLRFVLSPAGQDLLRPEDGYLPLPPSVAESQLP